MNIVEVRDRAEKEYQWIFQKEKKKRGEDRVRDQR